MLAAYASSPNADDPLSALEVGDRPDPEPGDGWVTVDVKAASLNMHDVFTLRGVGIKEDQFPMILGCDGAGTTEDGSEVVIHGVVPSPGWVGDETLDPKRTLLSEKHQGTMAEKVVVPERNVLPKPDALSFAEAACLGTAWLTAYRMLFVKSGPAPGPDDAGPGRVRRRGHRADRARLERRHPRLGDRARPRRSGRSPRPRAPTPPSRPAPACPSAWTRCSRPWAAPRGRTR